MATATMNGKCAGMKTNDEPRALTAYDDAAAELVRNLETCNDLIEHLTERLDRIMMPPVPEKCAGELRSTEEPVSEVVAGVRQVAIMVANYNGRLQALLQRLEI